MLTGRIDDFQNGKIFGWAFNTDNEDEHLLIRISFGSQVIASGVANQNRPDLPDAGIGKGDHAFEISVPPHIVSLKGLVGMAQSSRHGDSVLPIASNDERHLDELFQVFADRYDEALRIMKDELDRLGEENQSLRESAKHAVTDLPADIERRLIALEHRMETSEVFFVRIDEMMQEQIKAGRKRSGRRLFGLFGGRSGNL